MLNHVSVGVRDVRLSLSNPGVSLPACHRKMRRRAEPLFTQIPEDVVRRIAAECTLSTGAVEILGPSGNRERNQKVC
jgi:hypothetical protein